MEEINKLVDFLDWVHNNWYIPFGDDGEWKLDIDNEEYTGEVPNEYENYFSSDVLVIKYLNGEGVS